MDSLQDILGRKDFDVPPEVHMIKTFIRKQFSADAGVVIQAHNITIVVASAGLAGALRPLLYKLKKELETDKKLLIRIGVVK